MRRSNGTPSRKPLLVLVLNHVGRFRRRRSGLFCVCHMCKCLTMEQVATIYGGGCRNNHRRTIHNRARGTLEKVEAVGWGLPRPRSRDFSYHWLPRCSFKHRPLDVPPRVCRNTRSCHFGISWPIPRIVLLDLQVCTQTSGTVCSYIKATAPLHPTPPHHNQHHHLFTIIPSFHYIFEAGFLLR